MSKKIDGQLKIFEQLPTAYQALLHDLEEADIALLSKHFPKFNSAREFSNLVELGIDVAERRKELEQLIEETKDLEEDEKVTGYGVRIVGTFSTILGIPESTINHVTRSVEIMGGDYLRDVAAKATEQGLKLTYSHIRELNRLDSPDWKAERLEIIGQIFTGEIVTHREVKAAVDNLLGTVRTANVQYVASDDSEDEDKALARADKRSAKDEDALDDISTESDIERLCVGVVDLVGQVERKFDKLEEKLRAWRDDVSAEVLQELCTDSLDAASRVLSDFAVKVKDVSILLEEAMNTASAITAEV